MMETAMPVDARTRRLADRVLLRTVRTARGWWALLAAVTLVGVVLALAGPALVATAIDATLRATPERTRAVAAVAVLGVLGVVAGVAGQLAEACGLTRTEARLRGGLVRRLLALGPSAERRFPPGDVVSRLNSSAPQAAALAPKVIDLAAGLILALGAFAALARIDWRIVVVLATATPFVILIVRVLTRQTAVSTYAYQVAQGTLATRFVEALHGARTIRACDTVDVEIARVSEPLPELEAAGRAIWRAMGRSAGQAGLIVPLVGVVALAVAGQGLTAGRLSPGELLAATAYVPAALGLFDHIAAIGGLAVDRASAVRLAEVLGIRPAPPGLQRLPMGGGALSLHDVTVRAGERRMLRSIDLDVPAGTTLAVVGRSGAGKSTLALVAGGLWHPDEGRAQLDGIDLADLHPADRGGAVAFAFDVPNLVGTTIADAIGYGLTDPSRAGLYRALDRAAATPFVERLPGGIDAPLATAPFSGGERQRLGLARALVRHPRLLILDDATSSLDTVTEAQVQATLAGAGGGCTTIVVAHRPATAARADAVAWLDDGTLRAVGTHAHLWRDPRYRSVFAEEAAASAPDDACRESVEPDDAAADSAEPGLRCPSVPPGGWSPSGRHDVPCVRATGPTSCRSRRRRRHEPSRARYLACRGPSHDRPARAVVRGRRAARARLRPVRRAGPGSRLPRRRRAARIRLARPDGGGRCDRRVRSRPHHPARR